MKFTMKFKIIFVCDYLSFLFYLFRNHFLACLITILSIFIYMGNLSNCRNIPQKCLPPPFFVFDFLSNLIVIYEVIIGLL